MDKNKIKGNSNSYQLNDETIDIKVILDFV